jgi:hypothetical protein
MQYGFSVPKLVYSTYCTYIHRLIFLPQRILLIHGIDIDYGKCRLLGCYAVSLL